MTLDWLFGLVCGFIAAWFFLRGSAAGMSSRGGGVLNPFEQAPPQQRPDPPPAPPEKRMEAPGAVPPKPTPPPLRERHDRILSPVVSGHVVDYCAERNKGVFVLSETALCQIPPPEARH